MSLPFVITALYPQAVIGEDVILQDDGAGPYIKAWLRQDAPPTQAEIDAAMPAAIAAAARAAIRPVSARQMLTALDEQDMLDGIEAFVAGQPRVIQIAWERSQEFQRDNPLLAAGAAAFGLTDEQVDGLFALAATK